MSCNNNIEYIKNIESLKADARHIHFEIEQMQDRIAFYKGEMKQLHNKIDNLTDKYSKCSDLDSSISSSVSSIGSNLFCDSNYFKNVIPKGITFKLVNGKHAKLKYDDISDMTFHKLFFILKKYFKINNISKLIYDGNIINYDIYDLVKDTEIKNVAIERGIIYIIWTKK